ncbi:MAG: alpha/beta fold hydrolase, partial [Coriobacteriales bacterium]|nr:alpha/beta fold hydrolase [Coriobacteriales bacterium]
KDRLMDERLAMEYRDPGKQKKRRKRVRIGFCITLALLLVASLLNWGVITNWGQVSIQRINFSGPDGAHVSGLVYRPNNATDKTPSPAVLMLHGNSGNARNHESWALEFARRGFVVVVPDLYGAGDSQGYFDGGPNPFPPGTPVQQSDNYNGILSTRSLLEESSQFYDYMVDLPYVNSDEVIVAGHSMGGGAALTLGALKGSKGIMSASSTPATYFSNVDEFMDAYNNYQGDVVLSWGWCEMGIQPGDTEGFKAFAKKRGLVDYALNHTGDSSIQTLEPGKVYGSFDRGNAFVISGEERIHEAAFVSTESIGHLVQYGQDIIGDAVPNYIDPSDQVWPIKDYIALFGIFAFMAWLCATALLLIQEIPAFATVRRPLARNVGFRGKSLVIASLVALLLPYLVMKTDAFGIVGGKNFTNLQNAGFNLGFANMGFGVVVALSIACTLGLVIFIATERKKKGLALADFGLTPEGYDASASAGKKALAVAGMALKTLAVAALTIAIGWAYLQFQSTVLGTDFYAWFFGLKDIPLDKTPFYLNYLVVFIACFVVLSIDMNVIRRLPSTGSELKDTIIAVAVNIVLAIAVIIIVISVKWVLQTQGNPADSNWLWNMGLDVSRIWGLPVGMTCAAGGVTYIYRKTGNIWLCALLFGTVACLMGVLYGGTRFHYLTFFY